MERMEELIRQSLQARAQDVEPTPALWLEVDRRVARRRRLQVVTWSLAGVAAAVLAVFAVPAVIGLFSGPDQLDIAPLDRTPAGGVVPTHVVTVEDDGVARLVDLRTGDAVRDLAELPFVPADLAVSPVSTVEAVELVAIAATGELAVVGPGGETWSSGTVDAPDGFARSVVAAPDGRWFATTSPTQEADGATVAVAPPPSSWGPGEDVTWTEIGMVTDAAHRLVAWTGATADEGDRSTLWLVTGDGALLREQLEVIDGVPTYLEIGERDQREQGARVLDAAPSFVRGGADGEASYLLVLHGAAAPALELVESQAATTSTAGLPLAPFFGEVDPADLWLDAKQDAALVGDGERTWLFAHDGAGGFAEPTALPDGTVRAGLLDVQRPGGATTDDLVDEPATEPTDPEEAQPEGPVVEGAPLPAPIVTVSRRDLVLHGPDGARTLYTLPEEGESTFVSARVRPGSTVDDLVVAALVRAEGMLDLREYRWDGRELTWDYLPDHLQPGVGDDADAGPQAHGPVWSPDGDRLAWFEFGTGAAPTLRVIGWTDTGPGTGEPATDNASFTIDTLGNVPLVPVEWVATPGWPASTAIHAVALDSTAWYLLPVDIQADGAVALVEGPGGQAPGEFVPSAQFERGAILGVASDDETVRWTVQLTSDGLVLEELPDDGPITATPLPADLSPDDGLVEAWVRAIGDGALVGSPRTASAYYVAPDGSANRLPGPVIDADVVR
jgi:hypothetical protein